jgi:hypothetical protein
MSREIVKFKDINTGEIIYKDFNIMMEGLEKEEEIIIDIVKNNIKSYNRDKMSLNDWRSIIDDLHENGKVSKNKYSYYMSEVLRLQKKADTIKKSGDIIKDVSIYSNIP